MPRARTTLTSPADAVMSPLIAPTSPAMPPITAIGSASGTGSGSAALDVGAVTVTVTGCGGVQPGGAELGVSFGPCRGPPRAVGATVVDALGAAGGLERRNPWLAKITRKRITDKAINPTPTAINRRPSRRLLGWG